MPAYHDIADWYLRMVVTDADFFKPVPVRKYTILYPGFVEVLMNTINAAKIENMDIVLVETYRSNTLQAHYYKIGASKIKRNGMHHFGIACDTMFKDADGRATYRGNYKRLHEIFENCGGDGEMISWDIGHFQLIKINQQNELRDAVINHVKNFQRQYNLLVDGIVGNQTRTKAIEVFS